MAINNKNTILIILKFASASKFDDFCSVFIPNTTLVMHYFNERFRFFFRLHVQRQLMENYIKQKRATPGMVQASDLQMRPMSGSAQIATSGKANSGIRVSSSREIHAYDGPMQYMMSPNNPDQILPTSALTSPSSEGIYKH